MKYYDNFMVPVITVTVDGIITYKNRAAKRCIPSPRTKANILNYINKRNLKFRRDLGSVRIEHIKNDKSIFNRAMVVCPKGENTEVWFFSPDLQLFEPEDIRDKYLLSMADCIESTLEHFTEKESNDTKSLFNRYQRIGEELLIAMKNLNIKDVTTPLKLNNVISSIKTKTEDITKKLNMRICVTEGICDPSCKLELRFRPFASVYAELLHLIIRISVSREITVNITQSKDRMLVTFESDIIAGHPIHSSRDTLEDLASLFPDELINMMFLEQEIKLRGYKLQYTAGNHLTLQLSVPLDDRCDLTLGHSRAELVVQKDFTRAKKRALEFLESILISTQKS